MIDYESLAKRAVEQKIVEINWSRYFVGNEYICGTKHPKATEVVCKDGRVILAAMEKVTNQEILIWQQHYEEADPMWTVEMGNAKNVVAADGWDESLAIAILTACLEALES